VSPLRRKPGKPIVIYLLPPTLSTSSYTYILNPAP
jgi:hypothetical protein